MRPRVDLLHQAEIVGGDHHRGAEPVELDEQAQQAARERRIDIAGRLVGEQDLGCSISARAIAARCFSPPESTGGSTCMRSPRPTHFSEFDDVAAIARFLAPAHAQRQRDVLVGGHVVEQAEILEDHADAAAQQRQLVRVMRARSLPKTVISPRVGFSDRNSSLSSVVLPAPEGPLRNWKERAGICERDGRGGSPGPCRIAGRHSRSGSTFVRHYGIPGTPEPACSAKRPLGSAWLTGG